MSKYVISSTFPQISYHEDPQADILTMGNFSVTFVQPAPTVVAVPVPLACMVASEMAPQVNVVQQMQEPVSFQMREHMTIGTSPSVVRMDAPMAMINSSSNMMTASRSVMSVESMVPTVTSHSHVIAFN